MQRNEEGGLIVSISSLPDFRPEADPLQRTALHVAAKKNSVDVVETLITYGADVNALDKHELTPLHIAAKYNPNVDVIRALVEAGAAVDACAYDVVNGQLYKQFTPLHFAAKYNPSAHVIRALADEGADFDARADYPVNGSQWTPLHYAARFNPSADVIRVLVDKGADPDARDDCQRVPLHIAAQFNEGKVMILIERGANVNLLTRIQS